MTMGQVWACLHIRNGYEVLNHVLGFDLVLG